MTLGLLTLPIDESDLVTVPVMREELLLVTPWIPWRGGGACAAGARWPAVRAVRGRGFTRRHRRFFASEHIGPIVMDTENVRSRRW